MNDLRFPEMDYELAGKEAYAQDEPISFTAIGSNPPLRFTAYPDGLYIRQTPLIEPRAPSSSPIELSLPEEFFEGKGE